MHRTFVCALFLCALAACGDGEGGGSSSGPGPGGFGSGDVIVGPGTGAMPVNAVLSLAMPNGHPLTAAFGTTGTESAIYAWLAALRSVHPLDPKGDYLARGHSLHMVEQGFLNSINPEGMTLGDLHSTYLMEQGVVNGYTGSFYTVIVAGVVDPVAALTAHPQVMSQLTDLKWKWAAVGCVDGPLGTYCTIYLGDHSWCGRHGIHDPAIDTCP